MSYDPYEWGDMPDLAAESPPPGMFASLGELVAKLAFAAFLSLAIWAALGIAIMVLLG